MGDAGMVGSLESIQGVENKKLLAGHIAMFLQDFDLAQVSTTHVQLDVF